MSRHPNFPIYYTPTTANSGIVNIFGGIVQKPLPVGFKGPSTNLNTFLYYIYPGVKSDEDRFVTKSLGFTYITPKYILYELIQYDTYTLGVSTEGLEVFNYVSNTNKCTIKFDNYTPNTLWCNTTYLYLGSSIGLYSDTISGVVDTCTYSGTEVDTYTQEITYLDGNNNSLFFSTASGVEYINTDDNTHTCTYIDNTGKCALTSNAGYYVTTSGDINNINIIKNVLHDWEKPDYVYTTGSGILASGITITDLFLVEGTGSYSQDTILCATSSGVYIIDSGSDEYRTLSTPDLEGSTNNFVAVWSDNDTSKENGTVYISTEDTIQVVNLIDGQLDVVFYDDTTVQGGTIYDMSAEHTTRT